MTQLVIEWRESARADVRRMDRTTAMRVFEAVLEFSQTGSGNTKPLRGDFKGFQRLRVGDHRVIFAIEERTMVISGVRHRSDAYR